MRFWRLSSAYFNWSDFLSQFLSHSKQCKHCCWCGLCVKTFTHDLNPRILIWCKIVKIKSLNKYLLKSSMHKHHNSFHQENALLQCLEKSFFSKKIGPTFSHAIRQVAELLWISETKTSIIYVSITQSIFDSKWLMFGRKW